MKIKDAIFKIENLSFSQALEYIVKRAKERDKKTFVITINTEILMLARGNKEYERVLNSADLAVNDSIGIIWAGKMFGKSFRERIHGVDLVDRLCKEVSKKPIKVGFLGGKQNVAERTAKCLREKYPDLKVAFAFDEWPVVDPAQALRSRSQFENFSDASTPPSDVPSDSGHGPDVHRDSNEKFSHENAPRAQNGQLSIVNGQLSCDILFVAYGSPKQEKWIYENLSKIDVRVAIGVGGAFDFISGRVRRAPEWVRRLGLEWLFRLAIQPWRVKRQTALIKFVLLVLKERFLYA